MKNKTLVKFLSAFLAVVMVLCSAPLSGFVGIDLPDLFSVKAEAYNTEGNFEYYVEDGGATLVGCVDPTGDIVIPSTLGGYPVTSIGYDAFYNCTSLTSVTIPDSVTSIGSSAFRCCTKLTSITIGNSVTTIYYYAFGGCTSLTSIAIPESVTSIGEYVFRGCTSLTSVTIPDSVTSIGLYAFYDCTSLARVYYTGDIKSWCGIAFDVYYDNPMYYAKNFYIDNTLVKEIVIPDTVTEIKSYAFYSFEGVTSVTIGDSVTSIGEEAFYNCTSLETVTIPDRVTSIGDCAFENCTSLASVTIGDSVTSIGDYAFVGCFELADVYYNGDIESWCEIEFYDDFNDAHNLYINGKLLENVVIPENTTVIKFNTFSGFNCIKTVTIPASIITIHENAFNYCENIENVYYGGTDAQWDEIAIYDGNDSLKNAKRTFLNGGHQHVYNSKITTEPTCTKEGVKTLECYCGDFYTESIPALGHTWGKWIVTLEPTATKDGRMVRACKVCVEAVQEEVIPKGTTPDIPDEPVIPDDPETELSVTVNDFAMNYKSTAKLSPAVSASGKYTVEYTSSDESVATVDKDGNVVALGEGNAEITVTVTDANGNTAKDTCKVTVTVAWWQWIIKILLLGFLWY